MSAKRKIAAALAAAEAVNALDDSCSLLPLPVLIPAKPDELQTAACAKEKGGRHGVMGRESEIPRNSKTRPLQALQ